MYPLKFEPLLKSVVWGGDKIVPYKGIESAAKNVGESWELSAFNRKSIKYLQNFIFQESVKLPGKKYIFAEVVTE